MPRYENIRVLSGTPSEVEDKLKRWFEKNAEHPNATLISTSIGGYAFQEPDPDAVAAEEKPGKGSGKKDKDSEKDKDKAVETGSAEAPKEAALLAIPMKTVHVQIMTATVGLVFP